MGSILVVKTLQRLLEGSLLVFVNVKHRRVQTYYVHNLQAS